MSRKRLGSVSEVSPTSSMSSPTGLCPRSSATCTLSVAYRQLFILRRRRQMPQRAPPVALVSISRASRAARCRCSLEYEPRHFPDTS